MAPGAAYTDHQFRSNAHTGPRATPTIPKGGVFSVYAEIGIPTPPQYPYEALLDIRTWREWNSFNPDVIVTKHSNPHSRDIRMEQGCFMTVSYQITSDVRKETKSVCRHLEPLKHKDDGKESHSMGGNVTRIRWTSDNANLLTPAFVLKTERVNEIEETSDGHCKYRTWLTFDGFSAKTMKKKYEKALAAPGSAEDECLDAAQVYPASTFVDAAAPSIDAEARRRTVAAFPDICSDTMKSAWQPEVYNFGKDDFRTSLFVAGLLDADMFTASALYLTLCNA
ncbi:uncharacterized protein MYCFIDRAFT_215631 [Pseudocercospora fijiensis CIRAD86]|uniref:Uncharacterized protein n=1 Tax=Pseudocercospora fijiensis (strain CIRAD86) TaxID=383855 RepID=M3AYP1_PSEFD|nr:uncharacterized protein MYCFIDRAFT_215631 [Pseudocercospora fijiensis CIRAD86]EME82273.1 hypothetical protein MYCFIDRAFT_215631 [Pseudocercospora fijiensis CIRAD86]